MDPDNTMDTNEAVDKTSTSEKDKETSQPEMINQSASSSESPNKPGIIVLQWLTYAFWGWTIVALGSLLANTVSYMITGAGSGSFTPYGIAAVLVLLPISAVCDFFYSKYEPVKKTGAASIVMVIHAVIFALLAIGSLIAVVFSLVSLITSDTSSEEITVAIITALSLAVIYTITFLRTLHPAKLKWLNRAYMIVMISVASIVIILSIIGPVNYERATKNDRLVADNISSLKKEVDSYANKNSKLPANLSEVNTKNPDHIKIIDKGLVTYTPNTKTSQPSQSKSRRNSGTVYFYQFCATYAKESDGYNEYDDNDIFKAGLDGGSYDDYSTYVNSYRHPQGEVCYKLKTGY